MGNVVVWALYRISIRVRGGGARGCFSSSFAAVRTDYKVAQTQKALVGAAWGVLSEPYTVAVTTLLTAGDKTSHLSLDSR